MKKLNIILAVKLLFALFAIGGELVQTNEYDMTDVNQKIKAITDKNLHVIISSIEVEELFVSPEFTALQTKSTNDWNQILDNLDAIEGDEGKKLVFWAMGQLAALDYITLLEKLTTKYETDTLAESLFRDALFAHGRMGAFTVDNYDHARMVAVLNRVKTKTADNLLKDRITEILSGEAKDLLDNYREGHEGLPEGNIPKVLLTD